MDPTDTALGEAFTDFLLRYRGLFIILNDVPALRKMARNSAGSMLTLRYTIKIATFEDEGDPDFSNMEMLCEATGPRSTATPAERGLHGGAKELKALPSSAGERTGAGDLLIPEN